jgi:hypothetical protein
MMRIFVMAAMVMTVSVHAYAQCSSPEGQETQTRYDFATHEMYYCNNTNWVEMGGGGGGFSNPATTTLDMGTNRIINLGTPTGNSDAATKEYVDVAAAAGGGGTSSLCYCVSGSDSCEEGHRDCSAGCVVPAGVVRNVAGNCLLNSDPWGSGSRPCCR